MVIACCIRRVRSDSSTCDDSSVCLLLSGPLSYCLLLFYWKLDWLTVGLVGCHCICNYSTLTVIFIFWLNQSRVLTTSNSFLFCSVPLLWSNTCACRLALPIKVIIHNIRRWNKASIRTILADDCRVLTSRSLALGSRVTEVMARSL